MKFHTEKEEYLTLSANIFTIVLNFKIKLNETSLKLSTIKSSTSVEHYAFQFKQEG